MATFAAAANGLAAGILQVNFQAPQPGTGDMRVLVGPSGALFTIYIQ
ncbi:MAG TPA: hypothetical protein VGH38_10715 [Bryobacteraceae bacterium]